MKFADANGTMQIHFSDAEERVVWQIVAARLKTGNAPLRDEFIRAVEEVARIGRQLREEPVQRRRPNGEVWTFTVDDDGRVLVQVTPGEEGAGGA